MAPSKLNNGGEQNIDALIGSGSVSIIAGGNALLTVGNNNSGGTFSGVISNGAGTLSLTKAGLGTETLSGANTFTGTTTVSAGSLKLGTSTTLATSTFNTSGPGSLDFGTFTTVTLGGLSGSGNLVLTNDSAQPVAIAVGANGTNTTFSGSLSGNLTKTGRGTLTLNGTNDVSGTTTISQGTIDATAAALTGSVILGDTNTGSNAVGLLFGGGGSPTASITVANQGTGTVTLGNYSGPYTTLTGTVSLNRAVTLSDGTGDRTTFNGLVSGNGTLTVTAGRITFGYANDNYGGNIVINSGTRFQTDAANVLSTSTSVTDNGTFQLNNGGEQDIDALIGSGSVSIIAGGNALLTVGNNNSGGTFSGVISNGGATLSLTKMGTGTLNAFRQQHLYGYDGDYQRRIGPGQCQCPGGQYARLEQSRRQR